MLARAPSADGVLEGLAGTLSREGRGALQAALIGRAAAWAREVAGRHAAVAVEPAHGVEEVAALVGDAVRVVAHGDRVAATVAAAFDRGGPVLVARCDVPRLSAAHAAAALADLGDGGQASFGPSMEGGWYLAALAEPRLVELVADVWEERLVMARTLEVAQRLQLDVGLIRMERALRTPADQLAMLADPLTPAEVSRILRSGI